MPNYYMVRAMFSNDAHFDEFFKKEIVAVGWSSVNFSSFKANELRNVIWENYYKDSSKRSQSISLALNQALMFKNIKENDRIVIPYRSGIVLALAKGEELYSQDACSLDLANQHRVSYKRKGNDEPLVVQRNDLSEGLQRRLRVRGRSVLNLNEFDSEIERMFKDSLETGFSYEAEIRQKEKNEMESFKRNLLARIQNGSTHLQTGGIGLEQLVCELLKCEGYEATILSKRSFPNSADADIRAIKEDSFGAQKLLVQVKHHHGYTGAWGLYQLNAIKEMDDEKYEDYNYVLLTSASVGDDVMKKSSEMGIDVYDGKTLVEIICSNIEKLSLETKRKLGISLVPHLNE